jgi:hypothetical protein
VSGDGASRSGSLSDETRDGNSDDDREDEDEDEVSSRPDLQFLCPHCPASFSTEELINAHIQEEHVIQLLERQIRHYQFGRNGHNGSAAGAAAGDVHQELAEHHLSVLMGQQRSASSLRPGSRTSSRSSSLSHSPESPTSRSHNRHLPRNECMEREFGNMLPFPLNGGIPALATGPDGKPIPMGMFPPFLFPVMSASGASGVTSGGTSVNGSAASGQNRSNAGSIPTGSGSFCIFNPEAYCELCNKEFCNKYFLKTHKANKHGIYTGDTPTSSSCPVSSSGSGNTSSNNNNHITNNSVSSGPNSIASPGPPAASTGNSGTGLQAQAAVSAAAAAASAFFPAGLVSQSPTDVQQQQQLIQQQLQQHNQNMSGTRITGPPVNPESFCEICQKAFCNKYFLKKHKHKIHGIHSDNSSSALMQQTTTSQSQDSLSSSPGRPADQPKSPVLSPQSTNGNNKSGELSASSNGVDPYSGIGLKDFCNMYFSSSKERKHKLQQEMFDIQTVVNNIHKAAAAAASTGQTLDSNSNSSPLKQLSRSPTPSMTSVAPVVVTNPANSPKNYCNICNKELCNKYFMKTHMLKMHGINIDEQPGEAAQASTIGGVTCDICQKELCSKYFLKVHKQNTHGIYEESSGKESRSGGASGRSGSLTVSSSDVLTESPNEKENSAIAARGIDPKDTNNRYFSHYTEVCPMCQRRFKSIKWLKTHVLNDHSDGLSPMNMMTNSRTHHHHHIQSQDQMQMQHELNPDSAAAAAALALVVSPKSQSQQMQRESPASSPQTGPSLPPDFACLNWLRSHIPPNDHQRESLVQSQSQAHMQQQQQQLQQHESDSTVKRERSSPQSNNRRQVESEIRKRETLSPSSSLPAMSPQFAIPQKPVAGGSFFMQAFNISEPDEPDGSRPANFVPSLVYLPVARQVKQPVVVAFQLTPA